MAVGCCIHIHTDDKTFSSDGQPGTTVKNCIGEVTQLMTERHELAKAKESISYGLQSSKFPQWMTSKLNCSVHLATPIDQDEFEIFWNEASNSAIRGLATKTVEYLTEHISDKQDKMQLCRFDAIKLLGDEESALKKEIDNKMTELNNSFSKELEAHRTKIRSSNASNTRGRSNYRGRHPFKSYRGRGYYKPS